MDELIAALCFQLPAPAADADSVDGWRVLIPAPNAEGWIPGDDGRAWRNTDPQSLVAGFNAARPIDVNHAEDLKAKAGDEAPAYGWVEEIRVANGGAIEGRLAFNRRGTEAVQNREYRYLSPAFRFHPQTKEIKRIDSASLVNTPNFALALNRRHAPDANDQPEAAMDLIAELRKALNLKDDANEQTVLDAVKTQGSELETARNRPTEQPSLTKYVPRADYDQLQQAKNHAEQQLAERDQADHGAKVEAAITAAKAAGKITPATEDYHRANCRTAEGLGEFEKFVAAAPAIGEPSGLENKTPGSSAGQALTDEEKAACHAIGVDEATFKERRDADAKAFG